MPFRKGVRHSLDRIAESLGTLLSADYQRGNGDRRAALVQHRPVVENSQGVRRGVTAKTRRRSNAIPKTLHFVGLDRALTTAVLRLYGASYPTCRIWCGHSLVYRSQRKPSIHAKGDFSEAILTAPNLGHFRELDGSGLGAARARD